VDRPAERFGHAKAHVVDQHNQNIGRTRGRLDLEPRGRRCIASIETRRY
jgi:hypothetical protein